MPSPLVSTPATEPPPVMEKIQLFEPAPTALSTYMMGRVPSAQRTLGSALRNTRVNGLTWAAVGTLPRLAWGTRPGKAWQRSEWAQYGWAQLFSCASPGMARERTNRQTDSIFIASSSCGSGDPSAAQRAGVLLIDQMGDWTAEEGMRLGRKDAPVLQPACRAT